MVKYIHFLYLAIPQVLALFKNIVFISKDSIWPRREAKDPEYKNQTREQRSRSTKPCVSQTINQNKRWNNAGPWETTHHSKRTPHGSGPPKTAFSIRVLIHDRGTRDFDCILSNSPSPISLSSAHIPPVEVNHPRITEPRKHSSKIQR